MKRTSLRILLPFLLLCSAIAGAQPTMTVNRIVNNWPVIQVFYAMTCNGQPLYVADKSAYTVREDGAPVGNFTVSCTAPVRCAMSVALVFDASGSMAGVGNAGAKAGGNAFIDLMDGKVDEAAVLWFSTVVQVQQGMTTFKDLLRSAVTGLPASGGTAVWDGAYRAVLELVNNGVNACRAVVVLTDGGDNSSSRSPAEVITLASKNGVRVYTIGLGSGVENNILRQIAQLTGGRYYQTSLPDSLVPIYQEIATTLLGNFGECVITYPASCNDGGTRTVELGIAACGGTATASKPYTTPRDTTTFQKIALRLPKRHGPANSEIAIPIEIMTPIAQQMLRSGTYSFTYDASCLQFVRAQGPAGSVLEGATFTYGGAPSVLRVTPVPDVPIRVDAAPRTLFELVFRNSSASRTDTIGCPVSLTGAEFPVGCLRFGYATGYVVTDADPGHVTLDGPPVICEGSARMLTAPAGFRSYLWSTGDTTRVTLVSTAGSYWCAMRDAGGNLVQSDTVVLTLRAAPKPAIAWTGDGALCTGDTVRLSTSAPYISYQWTIGAGSSGTNTPVLVVTKPDSITLTVWDSLGCIGSTSYVVRKRNIPPFSIGGNSVVCRGTEETYVTDNIPNRYFRWRALGGTFTSQTNTHVVTVRWTSPQGGYLTLVASEGHCADSVQQAITVILPTIPVITGPRKACPQSTITYSMPATAGHQYAWSVAGGSILGRSDSSVVTVQWGSEGNARIKARDLQGTCEGADSALVVISIQAAPVISILGSRVLCPGDSVVLDAGEWDNYLWSNGERTRRITVRQAGVFSVAVTGPGGCSGGSQSVRIEMAVPVSPVVMQTGNTLWTEPARSYQWSMGGVPQAGATGRFFAITASGRYTVTIVDTNGCTVTSAPYDAVINAVDNAAAPLALSIDWYPQPVRGDFTLRIAGAQRGPGSPIAGEAMLVIADLLGRAVYAARVPLQASGSTIAVPFTSPPPGVYTVTLSAGAARTSSLLVKAR